MRGTGRYPREPPTENNSDLHFTAVKNFSVRNHDISTLLFWGKLVFNIDYASNSLVCFTGSCVPSTMQPPAYLAILGASNI